MSERPEVLFLLANHQPASTRVRNELTALLETGMTQKSRGDYGVATVTWGGYALFADNVVSLEEFTQRLTAAEG